MGCNTSQEKPAVTPQVGDGGDDEAAPTVAATTSPATTTAENGNAAVLVNGASDAAPTASPSVNGKATDVAPLAAPDATIAGDEEDSVPDSVPTTSSSSPAQPPPTAAANCNGSAKRCDDEPAVEQVLTTTTTTTTATTTTTTTADADSDAVVLNGEVMGKAEGSYKWCISRVRVYYPNPMCCGGIHWKALFCA